MNRKLFLKKMVVGLASGVLAFVGLAEITVAPPTLKEVMDRIYKKYVKKSVGKEESTFKESTFGWDVKLTNLGFDSLDLVEFVMKLERDFGISIKDADAEKIGTPRQAAEVVFACLQRKK
jgi:acyl carrier protein